MHVESLTTYPITGAQGYEEVLATFGPSGLLGDRSYVLYDPESASRVSSKPNQSPELMRIKPHRGDRRPILDFHDAHGIKTATIDMQDFLVDGVHFGGRGDVVVTEFGQETPCIDVGDELAEVFSTFLKKDVRLAEKTAAWNAGELGLLAPAERKTAPYHIVSRASVLYLSDRLGKPDEDLTRRFRPNIVIAGEELEPFDELNWRALRVGDMTLRIVRPTPRCPVPGLDPDTGFNRKDVPKLYGELEKLLNNRGVPTAVFGVYAVLDGAQHYYQSETGVAVEAVHG